MTGIYLIVKCSSPSEQGRVCSQRFNGSIRDGKDVDLSTMPKWTLPNLPTTHTEMALLEREEKDECKG